MSARDLGPHDQDRTGSLPRRLPDESDHLYRAADSGEKHQVALNVHHAHELLPCATAQRADVADLEFLCGVTRNHEAAATPWSGESDDAMIGTSVTLRATRCRDAL